MYRCVPPTPSWLWGTGSIILGMNPPTSVPVVSVMYLPTVPLEFARPLGNGDDLELSSRRAVSRALAARTTTLARTRASAPVVLSTYATPVARPLESTSTSRAIAFVTRVSLPVASAGAIRTLVAGKVALTRQPRLHWPQEGHPARPFSRRGGVQGRPRI